MISSFGFEGGSKDEKKSDSENLKTSSSQSLQKSIKEKFNIAKINTMSRHSNKEFVPMNGEKDTDEVLKQMVGKIVDDQKQMRNSQSIGRNST